MRSILADAARDRLLSANPATGVKMPPKPAAKSARLTRGQLEALARESGKHGSLVLLLGVGGLRWGEAAALRVGDLDTLRRRVHLTRNAPTVNGKAVLGPLKTHANREVPLPGFVMDALAETARGKGRDDLLWPNRSGGHQTTPRGRTWLCGAVRRCMAADPTFPRVTAHDLRRTAASLAVRSGADVKMVQRMLGHANAAMTLNTYVRPFESDLDAAAEAVGKMWAKEAG